MLPSYLASGLICLSTGRTYNFSRLIFNGLVGNVFDKNYKLLMYPRFLQIILGVQTKIQTHYVVPSLSAKLFSTIKMNFDGEEVPLLPHMLVVPHNEEEETGEDAPVCEPEVATSVALIAGSSEVIPSTPPTIPTTELVVAATSELVVAASVSSPPTPPIMVPSTEPVVAATTATTIGSVGDKPVSLTSFASNAGPSSSAYVKHASDPFTDEGFDSGEFHMSPTRSREAPSTHPQAAGRAEDLGSLTLLSSALDRCMTKINFLEAGLCTTKVTMSTTIIKMVRKVRSLEVHAK